MPSADITWQALKDTANTRMVEAESLLDPVSLKKDRRDGAVTCALLAVECALKVLVLQRYGVDRASKLGEGVRAQLFQGKGGHNLASLEQHLDPVSGIPPHVVRSAISALHQLDRYEHRYGAQKPQRVHAQPKIEAARQVVDWMRSLAV